VIVTSERCGSAAASNLPFLFAVVQWAKDQVCGELRRISLRAVTRLHWRQPPAGESGKRQAPKDVGAADAPAAGARDRQWRGARIGALCTQNPAQQPVLKGGKAPVRGGRAGNRSARN